jgi:hypothetical protein
MLHLKIYVNVYFNNQNLHVTDIFFISHLNIYQIIYFINYNLFVTTNLLCHIYYY